MNITEEEIRTIKDCLGTTKDYIDYPHTHNGTTRLRKANNKAIELVNNLSQHLVSKRDFIKDDYVWFCGEINQVEAVKGNEVCIVELKGKLHQVVNKSELTNVC